VLVDTNEGLMEERRITVVEEIFKKTSDFLADTTHRSRGKPVIGAVKEHLERLELRTREDPKFKNGSIRRMHSTYLSRTLQHQSNPNSVLLCVFGPSTGCTIVVEYLGRGSSLPLLPA